MAPLMKNSGLTILQAKQTLQQDSTNVSTDESADFLETHLAKMKAVHSSGSLRRQFHAIVARNKSSQAKKALLLGNKHV